MFTNEVKVEGSLLKGKIIGNWSKDSDYAFELKEISSSEGIFSEHDLNTLIGELTRIRDKVTKLNVEHLELPF